MILYDVYAYGVISSSTLHLLKNPFPSPDCYAEISQTYSMTGGEALNSAIVLSRLGLRVQLDGNWLGDSEEGRQLLKTIQQYSIDVRRLKIKKGFGGVKEIVFSDEESRTIFGNYLNLLFSTRKWNIPRKVDIAQAQIVSVDPPFQTESALVGKYATQLGIPFVSIDCSYEQSLATEAAVVIISGEYRHREYPQVKVDELFSEYQNRAKGLVVFTVGDKEVLYGRSGEICKKFNPYRVKVVDSAGAGDSFRAGVIYGLLKKWDDEKIIQYASAVAGLVCASFPGVIRSPTHMEVMNFIQNETERMKPLS